MIVVFGGTGRVGGSVVDALQRDPAARPNSVVCRVFARNPDRVYIGPGVEVVAGDFDDPSSVRRALDGCRRLFLCSPPHPELDRRESDIIHAAARAGVEAVVKISGTDGLVAARSRSLTMRQHFAVEQELEASGLRWAIIRPSAFIQTTMEQIAPFVRDSRRFALPGGGIPFSFVDVRDVGAVAAALLGGGGPWRRRLVLTGPEALTYEDIARLLAEELGEPVLYRRQSLFFARLAINQQVHYHHARNQLADLAALLSRGFEDHPTETVARLLGRPPRSVREWVHENRELFRR